MTVWINPFVLAKARFFGLVFLFVLATWPCLAQQSPVLEHAKANCVSFRFPRWDIHKIWDYSSNAELEFRATGDTEAEFLAALRIASYETGERSFWFSDQKYLISLKRPGEVQSVPDAVWAEAAIVNRYRNPFTSEVLRFARTLRSGEFDLASRTVKLRGKYWAGMLPDHVVYNAPKRYVALQSMNGRLLFDGEVYGGKAYVQVFDVASGEELFWIEGDWDKRASSTIFKNTEWIRDDLLAVSFDPRFERGTALCKVP